MTVPRFIFAQLVPETSPVAPRVNEILFASNKVYGIDIRDEGLLERFHSKDDRVRATIAGMIQPRFDRDNSVQRTAIEDALIVELPPPGTVLAIDRVNPSTIGAMAVMSLRSQRADLEVMTQRIKHVTDVDRWSLWLLSCDSSARDSYHFIAYRLSSLVANPRSPLGDRVGMMADWLQTGRM